MLTAYSESDFNGQARSGKPTSSGYYSEGIFQQTLPWWENDHWNPEAAANAFIDQFRAAFGSPVVDCWMVQRWNAPDPAINQLGFWSSAETVNYKNRLSRVEQIIETGKLP